MPLFEFECKKCGQQFEALIRPHDDDNVSCPKCGSKKLRKLISGFTARSAGKKDYELKPVGGSSCASCTASSCAGCK